MWQLGWREEVWVWWHNMSMKWGMRHSFGLSVFGDAAVAAPPESSAGDKMLSNWPNFASKLPSKGWWGRENAIQQQQVFLGQNGSLPLLHLWRKERVPALFPKKSSWHFGRRHPPPSYAQVHKRTSQTHQKFLQLTSASTPPELVVSPWECLWSVPPDATITVTIGISSTSNYCQEPGFSFPQALMIISTLGIPNSVSSSYSTTCIWIFSHR